MRKTRSRAPRVFSPLVIALILATTPAWAARHRAPKKLKPALKQSSAHRKVARQRPPVRDRKVRLGLVPHHKGVANLFWMTKPIPDERQDATTDGTVRKSIPLN